MKQLFECFEGLQARAQALLEACLKQVSDGLAPDTQLCSETQEAMAKLGTAYEAIVAAIPEYLSPEELPEGRLAVRQYEELLKNSHREKRRAALNVLRRFFDVCAEDQKYMDAVTPYITAAKDLMVRTGENELPDVSVYRLFLDALDADLRENEALYDKLLDDSPFSPRIVKGLYEHKYRLRTNVDREETDAQEAKKEVADETPEERETAAEEAGASEVGETAAEEQETVSEETEEYIHPVNPIKETKLPSDQKMAEIIRRAGPIFAFLLDKMVFLGLMDQERVYKIPQCPVERQHGTDVLAFLERKGLISTYEYDGRRILCFTELMRKCLQKPSLASVTKRIFKMKTLGRLDTVARQDMPLKSFTERLAQTDQYWAIGDAISDNEVLQRILNTSQRDDKLHCFREFLALEDNKPIPLRIVAAADFARLTPTDGEGLICGAKELPDMNGVSDDMHYCTTLQGLYQFKDGKWIAIAATEAEETAAEVEPVSEPEPTPEPEIEPEPEAAAEQEASPEVEPEAESEPINEVSAPSEDEETDPSVSHPLGSSPFRGAMAVPPLKGEGFDNPPNLRDEPANEPADEPITADRLARQLLDAANAGRIPTDAQMAELIDIMLGEGVRSHDTHYCRDQIVEALVLAKLLSENEHFPACRNIYAQLHAAVPILQEGSANGGVALMNIFGQETKYTPAAKLCAYIYGMLFPAHAHDYTFSSLYHAAFADFEVQFPGLDMLKPLCHKAMQAPEAVPTAFSPANLSMLLDAGLRRERMAEIRQRACELLKLPTVKVMIRGVPELVDLCFGPASELHEAVNIVAENDESQRELVEIVLNEYYGDDEINIAAVDNTINKNWGIAAQKFPSRRMDVKYGLRKQLLRDFEERIEVLRDWLDETAERNMQGIEKLRPIRNELLRLIDKALSEMGKAAYTADTGIVSASLELIRARLECRSTPVDFSTLLRSGAVVIDHGLPVFNANLNDIKYAEPWRMMLAHIACTEYDLHVVYEKILSAAPEDTLYDNFGQLEAIGKLISADPQEYTLTTEGLQDAVSSAKLQARIFREKLEISYAYNRISEIDRERLAQLADPDTSSFRDFFYEHRAFGCWRGFLGALQAQRRELTGENLRLVRTLLEKSRQQLKDGENSLLLDEAERLIDEEQNFAVAEDYIRRFRNGERILPFESNDGATNYFLDFVSEPVFSKLYDHCERHKDSPLSRCGVQYIERNKPIGWTTRHMDDAKKFVESWPRAKQTVDQMGIQRFFNLLGLDVIRCKRYMRGSEVCFTLSVNTGKQNQADYRHPIAMFGTQMKPEIEAVCLFGKRTSRQIIDDACRLGIPNTFIVLLDADLSAQDRRMMAQYFFTQKNVGQASFLVIDRVLAIYLALQPSNERLPAMLQCTLPYTIYQPFTNGSGSTADEMFFGRVKELASIRDMTGTSIVYGGRQLGKTALLERAKHLDNNPERAEFAVMTNFKGCRGEQAFLDRLIPACNETLAKGNIRLRPCSGISEFCTQIRRLLDEKRINTLRLLLDEADDFLDSVSSSGYSELLPLIELQRGSNRRFKFVLAGLHNVCRAKNATRNNGLFGQLGAPLCVKPLTAADARNLLLRPLRYLGFKVSDESHIDTILINTNYYPGIIQFFGYTLVQTLAAQYTHYYDPVRGNPPYDLRDEQLASIVNSKDLNHNIKERLRWTLEMDGRYYMLARCITLLYHMADDQSMISNGFAVGDIIEVARMYTIRCLSRLSEREYVTLLDEMEEMGILSKPVAGENRYLLRRRSFIDVIGANLDTLEHDLTHEEAGDDV